MTESPWTGGSRSPAPGAARTASAETRRDSIRGVGGVRALAEKGDLNLATAPLVNRNGLVFFASIYQFTRKIIGLGLGLGGDRLKSFEPCAAGQQLNHRKQVAAALEAERDIESRKTGIKAISGLFALWCCLDAAKSCTTCVLCCGKLIR